RREREFVQVVGEQQLLATVLERAEHPTLPEVRVGEPGGAALLDARLDDLHAGLLPGEPPHMLKYYRHPGLRDSATAPAATGETREQPQGVATPWGCSTRPLARCPAAQPPSGRTTGANRRLTGPPSRHRGARAR